MQRLLPNSLCLLLFDTILLDQYRRANIYETSFTCRRRAHHFAHTISLGPHCEAEKLILASGLLVNGTDSGARLCVFGPSLCRPPAERLVQPVSQLSASVSSSLNWQEHYHLLPRIVVMERSTGGRVWNRP